MRRLYGFNAIGLEPVNISNTFFKVLISSWHLAIVYVSWQTLKLPTYPPIACLSCHVRHFLKTYNYLTHLIPKAFFRVFAVFSLPLGLFYCFSSRTKSLEVFFTCFKFKTVKVRRDLFISTDPTDVLSLVLPCLDTVVFNHLSPECRERKFQEQIFFLRW